MPIGTPPSFYAQSLPPQARQQALLRFLGQLGPSLLGTQAVMDPGGAFGRGIASGVNAYDAYLAQNAAFERQQQLDALERQRLDTQQGLAQERLDLERERVDLTERNIAGDEAYRTENLALQREQLEQSRSNRAEDVEFRERRFGLDERELALRQRELDTRIANIEAQKEKMGQFPMDKVIDDARLAANEQMDAILKRAEMDTTVTIPPMVELFDAAFNQLMPRYISAYGMPEGMKTMIEEEQRRLQELGNIDPLMPDVLPSRRRSRRPAQQPAAPSLADRSVNPYSMR